MNASRKPAAAKSEDESCDCCTKCGCRTACACGCHEARGEVSEESAVRNGERAAARHWKVPLVVAAATLAAGFVLGQIAQRR